MPDNIRSYENTWRMGEQRSLNVLEVLRSRFTLDDLITPEQIDSINKSLGKDKKAKDMITVINDLCDNGSLKAASKNGKRFYQLTKF